MVIRSNKYASDYLGYKYKYFRFADADSKTRIYTARYQMLLQRTSRHKLFAKNDASAAAGGSASEDGSERKYALKSVDFLLGTNTR